MKVIKIKDNYFTARPIGDSKKLFEIWNANDISPIRWATIQHQCIEFNTACFPISERELEMILQLLKKVNKK